MNELKRQLGLSTAIATVIGEVIAVGIFLTPAGMIKSIGSPFWLLIVWLTMGLMAICGALCYGELATRFPEAGGGYVYLREAFGKPIAFLYGWKSFLVMDPGITAALAVGLASYVGYMVKLAPFGIKIVAISTILILAAVNIIGIRLGAWLIRGLTFIKVGFLMFIAIWAVGFQLGDLSNLQPFFQQKPGSDPLSVALAGGIVAAFFSFGGWWDAGKIAGEITDPNRNLPRAFIYGVLVITTVYITTTMVFMYLVPVQDVTSGETFAAQAGEVLFGYAGGQVFSIIVIISVLGSLLAIIMTAPRVYYAMARNKLFLSAAAKVHPKYGTPARAIIFQAMLASILVALGTFNQIVSYFVFVTVFFIALTVIALFILRKKQSGSTGYLTPGYPWTPAIFLFLIIGLLVLLAGNNPLQVLLGVGVVLLGIPVYYFNFKRKGG